MPESMPWGGRAPDYNFAFKLSSSLRRPKAQPAATPDPGRCQAGGSQRRRHRSLLDVASVQHRHSGDRTSRTFSDSADCRPADEYYLSRAVRLCTETRSYRGIPPCDSTPPSTRAKQPMTPSVLRWSLPSTRCAFAPTWRCEYLRTPFPWP